MLVVVAVGLVFVALVVTLIVVSARRERARIARLRRWAVARGWTLEPRPSVEWLNRLPAHRRRGRVTLMLSGVVDGRPVSVAEYSYTTESTTRGSDSRTSTTTTTHRLLVTAVRLPVEHPPLIVEPRGALSRLGRSVFGDNAAATGHDAFDRQFRVRARDLAVAHTLIGPALVAEHLAGRVPPWDLADQYLLTWQPGGLRDPHQVPDLAAALSRVADLLGR